jgi:formate hydrogenlyase transcriptional activator
MKAEPLLALAATVSGEHSTRIVLDTIVQGLAKQAGVALARIWLLRPGDICGECFLRNECNDQSQCLHLAASAGSSLDGQENWSSVDGHFRRIPLHKERGKVGVIGATGNSIRVGDFAAESEWIGRPDWARTETIRSFAGHALVFRNKPIGVLAVFSRETISEQDFVWLKMFADQAAVALSNAQVFEDLKRAQVAQQEHASELRQVIDIAPLHMFIWEADASASYGNRTALEYFGPILPKHPMAFLDQVTHPEDVAKLKQGIQQAFARSEPFEREVRMRRHDGEYRWFLYQLRPLRDQQGQVSRWCGTRIDIDDQKRAADQAEKENVALREHLSELQQVMDVVPQHMYVLQPDGSSGHSNRAAHDFFEAFGPIPAKDFLWRFGHPEDLERTWAEFEKASRAGAPFQLETRLRNRDGQFRWFLEHLVPIRDAQGQIFRWCGVRTDIHEQKQIQERARQETLALREEVDRASMFEEIVGMSAPLQAVLARVARVAPTDSTVLITGETGTGKELIARAIHKRSNRASRAFVSVNCAAIPRDLIASELFGHEKGAFTGALQRRLGRFELAEGGTIFLDEIGELPADTQVALLRVLQEREFDRVGGSRPIRADVRVIAATHRDLPAAIAAGAFRSDLFYRINVFPIEIPPLRQRREDIRLLVEYFIDRFSSRSGKKILRIDRASLEHLQTYSWPGNIRELQNVIERSVIVCDTEDFSVDESWLSQGRSMARPLADELVSQEKEEIESALARAKGRVSGPQGAAVMLGMPASTLDSKIKSLRIDKRRFQAP